LPCTTSGQETERVYSYNPGACTVHEVEQAFQVNTKVPVGGNPVIPEIEKQPTY